MSSRVCVWSLAYLIGSIPFGYLIVKRTSGRGTSDKPVRAERARPTFRDAQGKPRESLTLMLDALKGAIAVLIAMVVVSARLLMRWIVPAAAIAAIVGHIFPVWLSFRGGKGVATGVGVFLC